MSVSDSAKNIIVTITCTLTIGAIGAAAKSIIDVARLETNQTNTNKNINQLKEDIRQVQLDIKQDLRDTKKDLSDIKKILMQRE